MLLVPVADRDEAHSFLVTTPLGLSLIESNPYLSLYQNLIGDENVNILPMYGRSLKENRYNLFNIIAASHQVQKQADAHLQKALVMAIFHDQDEILPNEIAYNYYLNDIPALYNASLLQAHTIPYLTFEPQKIYILFMGKLPKIVFDGLYSAKARNIWPPIREGASSLTTLLPMGQPHIYCRDQNAWEVIEFADVGLKEKLKQVEALTCQPDSFKVSETTTRPFVDFILDSQHNDSQLNTFFRRTKSILSHADNDRIASALLVAAGVSAHSANEVKSLLAPFTYRGFYSKTDRMRHSIGSMFEEKNTFRQSKPCVCPMNETRNDLNSLGNPITDIDNQKISLNNSIYTVGFSAIALMGLFTYSLFARRSSHTKNQPLYHDNAFSQAKNSTQNR